MALMSAKSCLVNVAVVNMNLMIINMQIKFAKD